MKLIDFLFENIRLKYGKIIYSDINDIDLKRTFQEQKWSYKEDMLQIGFADQYIIDIGWFPEHKSSGKFILTVVKNFDWYNPVVRKKIKSIQNLKKNLEIEVNRLEHTFSIQ